MTVEQEIKEIKSKIASCTKAIIAFSNKGKFGTARCYEEIRTIYNNKLKTMGLFVCAKCGCVENTALGWWWGRLNIKLVLPPDMKQFESGKGLCSECIPAEAEYPDGSGKGKIGAGKWHNKFPKETYEEFIKDPETAKHYKRFGDSLEYIK